MKIPKNPKTHRPFQNQKKNWPTSPPPPQKKNLYLQFGETILGQEVFIQQCFRMTGMGTHILTDKQTLQLII